MRSLLKYTALPFSVLLLAGSCNNNRIGSEDEEGGDGEDMSVSGIVDLAGADLRKPRDRDAACAEVKAEATLEKKPVDIIFIIDNSGSMTDEILAVQQNINKNFADIIGKSGLDYRVVMVTSHGDAASRQSICVSAPLSKLASCSPVPAQPGNNPPKFYHYSVEVESTDSFSIFQRAMDGTLKDQFNLAMGAGVKSWLRTDSLKVFIEITDDNSDSTHTNFDSTLLTKWPTYFGSVAARNYVFYSIVGLKENNPRTKPWAPMDPIQTALCTNGGGAVANGIEYQKLSVLTGGLRFPICEHASFDAVFNSVAMGVISGAKVACEFPVPAAPAGQKIDPDSIIVEYTPMGTGTPKQFKQVAGAGVCQPDSFYIEGTKIKMCPDACTQVQQDSKAKVNVVFDCLSVIG